MSRDALARLFPDGKTVFIPSDGQPMPGYELAKAEIEPRGGEIQTASGGGLFAWLFRRARRRRGRRGGGRRPGGGRGIGPACGRGGGGGGGGHAPAPVEIAEAGPAAVDKAKASLPTGPGLRRPAPRRPAAPARPRRRRARSQRPKPEVVAKIEEPKVESDASAARRSGSGADRGALARAHAAPASRQSRTAARPARQRSPSSGPAHRPRRRRSASASGALAASPAGPPRSARAGARRAGCDRLDQRASRAGRRRHRQRQGGGARAAVREVASCRASSQRA